MASVNLSAQCITTDTGAGAATSAPTDHKVDGVLSESQGLHVSPQQEGQIRESTEKEHDEAQPKKAKGLHGEELTNEELFQHQNLQEQQLRELYLQMNRMAATSTQLDNMPESGAAAIDSNERVTSGSASYIASSSLSSSLSSLSPSSPSSSSASSSTSRSSPSSSSPSQS